MTVRTIGLELSSRAREFVITPTPDDPSREPWAIVYAINALDALDQYSVSEGYSSYSGLDEPAGVIGTDEHGLWAVFTNTTIWAVPVDPVVVEKLIPEGRLLVAYGLWVIVTRNTETGQLIVNINSEGVDAEDEDEEGAPYIEVTINDVTVLDWEKPE